jgi:hypothetical protein
LEECTVCVQKRHTMHTAVCNQCLFYLGDAWPTHTARKPLNMGHHMHQNGLIAKRSPNSMRTRTEAPGHRHKEGRIFLTIRMHFAMVCCCLLTADHCILALYTSQAAEAPEWGNLDFEQNQGWFGEWVGLGEVHSSVCTFCHWCLMPLWLTHGAQECRT